MNAGMIHFYNIQANETEKCFAAVVFQCVGSMLTIHWFSLGMCGMDFLSSVEKNRFGLVLKNVCSVWSSL